MYRDETYLRTCTHREDSDQPAHSHSLIRIFNGRILMAKDAGLLHANNTNSDQNAQANLIFRWAHMSVATFSHAASHFVMLALGMPSY